MTVPVADPDMGELAGCPKCLMTKIFALPSICGHDKDKKEDKQDKQPEQCSNPECVKEREEKRSMDLAGQALSKELVETYVKLIQSQLQLSVLKVTAGFKDDPEDD